MLRSARSRRSDHHPIFAELQRLAPFTKRGLDVNVVLDRVIHDIDIILLLVNYTRLCRIVSTAQPPLCSNANAQIRRADPAPHFHL